MILSTHYIDAYTKQESNTEEMDEIFLFTNGKRPIEDYRQEVCLALCDALLPYQKKFPLWNYDMIATLFHEDLMICKDITLLPIVGAHADFDCELIQYHGTLTLVLDLLNIANYTNVLKEMEYIVHNLIHKTLIRYLLTNRFSKPVDYRAQLLHRCFVQGGSQFLAWRDGLEPVFVQPQYQEKYERSTLLLEKACQVEDSSIQAQILTTLETCDLWNDFATCYGMFTFAQTYQKEKEKGLYEVFIQGPNSIIHF